MFALKTAATWFPLILVLSCNFKAYWCSLWFFQKGSHLGSGPTLKTVGHIIISRAKKSYRYLEMPTYNVEKLHKNCSDCLFVVSFSSLYLNTAQATKITVLVTGLSLKIIVWWISLNLVFSHEQAPQIGYYETCRFYVRWNISSSCLWLKARSHGTLQSVLNAHSIRFASVHMNPLLLDATFNAHCVQSTSGGGLKVDWKRIEFSAWADASRYKALGGLNDL